MDNHLLGELGVSRSIGSFNLKMLQRHPKSEGLSSDRIAVRIDADGSPLSSECDVVVMDAKDTIKELRQQYPTTTNATAATFPLQLDPYNPSSSSSSFTTVNNNDHSNRLLLVLSGSDGLWDVGSNEEILDELLRQPFMIKMAKSYILGQQDGEGGICGASMAAAASTDAEVNVSAASSSFSDQRSRELVMASEQHILTHGSSDSVVTSPLNPAVLRTPPVRPTKAFCTPNPHLLDGGNLGLKVPLTPQMRPTANAASAEFGMSTPNGQVQFSTPKKDACDKTPAAGSLQQAIDGLIDWAIHTKHGSDNVTVTLAIVSVGGVIS
eukprot:GFYU01032364.1.p1 GENE.GFYU01032364.1~~GFYU01032364.1.p1  ORF type:complete len:369 (+),score=-9.68 GFYU01032364.1:137-1108(+)